MQFGCTAQVLLLKEEGSNFLAAPESKFPMQVFASQQGFGIRCGLSDEFVVAAIEPIGPL